MASVRTAKPGENFYDVLTVFSFTPGQVVTGESSGDFVVQFFKNNTSQIVTYSIEEIGSTGSYCIILPDGFPTQGTWVITVFVNYNKSVWRSVVEVREHDIDDVYDVILAGGSGVETVQLTIIDIANANSPIPDLLINVYDETGVVFITFGRTNMSGQITFLLDDGSYVLRMFKPGVSCPEETIVVPIGGLVATLECESIVVQPPPSPQLCRIFADFIDMEGNPYADFKIRIDNLFDPAAVTGLAVMAKTKTVQTDASGHVEFDLVRGTKIKVSFVTSPLTREFVVPDMNVANLTTLVGTATDAFKVKRK